MRHALQWLLGRLEVVAIAVIIAVLDLILLEKKFNIFSGGFLQLDQLQSTAARFQFSATVLVFELALASLFWQLIRLTGKMQSASLAMCKYRFVFLYGFGSIAVLVAKYNVIAYFGDQLSFAVLRNLGGGSVKDALLYSMEEGLLYFAGAALAGAVFWLLYRRLTRRHRAPMAARTPPRRTAAKLGVSLLVLFSMANTVASDATMHRQLRTVTPYWLSNEVLKLWRPARSSSLVQLAAHSRADAPPAEVPARFGTRRDNLVLIVSESTRADVLEARIAAHPVTPVWRQLAAEGGAAGQYYSHTGFTTTSLKAIFKGNLDPGLASGDTLFSTLKQNGYQIVVLSGQDESFGDISVNGGAQQAADIFFDARSDRDSRVSSSAAAGSLALSNSRLVTQFDRVLKTVDWSRPIFFYINFQAAHFPYHHPGMARRHGVTPLARGEISAGNRDRLRLSYLNAVADSDAATGEIVARLRTAGVYDKSLVVVSGDHGEALFEEGLLGHGIKIADAQLHTLLVANRPLPELVGLLGQTDVARMLLKGVGAQFAGPAAAPRSAVLQYVGDLKSPSELGYVYAGGERLTLLGESGQVRASWLNGTASADALAPDSREKRELDRLVAEWKGIARP